MLNFPAEVNCWNRNFWKIRIHLLCCLTQSTFVCTVYDIKIPAPTKHILCKCWRFICFQIKACLFFNQWNAICCCCVNLIQLLPHIVVIFMTVLCEPCFFYFFLIFFALFSYKQQVVKLHSVRSHPCMLLCVLIYSSAGMNVAVVDFLLLNRHLWQCWCGRTCNPICCRCHKCY